MDILKRHMGAIRGCAWSIPDAYFGLSNYADHAKWGEQMPAPFRRRGDPGRPRRNACSVGSGRFGPQGRGRTLLEELARGYKARQGAERNLNYFREAWLGPSEALLVA